MRKKLSSVFLVLLVVTLVFTSINFEALIVKASPLGDNQFGYDGSYDGSTTINHWIIGSWFSCPEWGTAKNISAQLWQVYGTTSVKCAIYMKSDMSLVGYTEAKSISSSGWYTFSFSGGSGEFELKALNYYLVAWGSGGGACYLRCTSETGKGNADQETYGEWPDPMATGSNDYKYCIYLTYEDKENCFGFMEEGTDGSASIQNCIRGSWFTAPCDLTAKNITTYIDVAGSATVQCAIHDKTDDSLVGSTENESISSDGWYTFNFSSSVGLYQSVDYYLVAWSSGMAQLKYDTLTNKGGEDLSASFPIDPWYPTSNDHKYSIFCCYEEGAPPVPPAYSFLSHNMSVAGRKCGFFCKWTAGGGRNLSHYRFDWKNGTESWINGTWTDWSGSPTVAWSNVTKILNYTVGSKIQFIFYANDTEGSTSNTGVQTFYTRIAWWDKVVDDAEWAWEGLIELRDDFNPLYGNLTPTYHIVDGASDLLSPDLLSAGLHMYKMTGNTTYLEYARDTCDDWIYYCQHNETKLFGAFSNSTGEIVSNSTSSMRAPYVLSKMALEDSSYVDELEQATNAIITYNLEGNDAGYALPVYSYVNGTEYSNQVYMGTFAELAQGLLWAYYVTDNTTYRNWARNMIMEWWDTKIDATKLVPDGLNTENKGALSSDTKQHRQGAFLRTACIYYLFDQNSTIYNIINDNAKAICNYFFDGDNWDYRINIYNGSAEWDDIEANWVTTDYGMLLAYQIVGNQTFQSYAFQNFDSTFQDDEYGLYNLLFPHATEDDGTLVNPESHMEFAFFGIPSVWSLLYHCGGSNITDKGLDLMYGTYNQTIYKHPEGAQYQNGKYGYRKVVKVTDFSNYTAGHKGNRDNVAVERISTWLQFMIRPSPSVNITWCDFPQGELYQPWIVSAIPFACWWTNVTFNYESQKITFDEITGAGEVEFYEQVVVSVECDGELYSNFTKNILYTKNGGHSYIVFLKSVEYEQYERVASQGINFGSSVSYLAETFGSVAQQITFVLETSYLAEAFGDVSQAIGVALSSSRLFDTLKDVSQTVNFGSSVAYLAEVFGAVSQSVSFSSIGNRLIEIVDSVSQAIPIDVAGTYLAEAFGTVSQSLNFALDTARLQTLLKSVSQQLTLSLTGNRLLEMFRSVSQTLSFSSVGNRLIDISKTASQTIGVALNGEYLAEMFANVAQLIGLALSVIPTFFKTASQAITFLSNATYLKHIYKTIVQTLTFALFGSPYAGAFRQAYQTLNFGVGGNRLLDILKGVSQAVSLASNGERLIEVTHQATQSITVSLTAWGGFVLERAGSLALTLSMSASMLSHFMRNAIQTINAQISVLKTMEFFRGVTQSIGVALESMIEMVGLYYGTGDITITVAISVSTLKDLLRAASQSISVALATSTLAEFVRAASQGLTLSLQSSWNVFKIASQNISVGLSAIANTLCYGLASLTVSFSMVASLAGEYLRSATQTVSLALSGELAAGQFYERASSLAIGVSVVIISVASEFVRSATQTLATSFSSTRLIDVTLQATQTITVALSGLGYTAFKGAGSLALTFATNVTSALAHFIRTATQTITTTVSVDRLIEITKTASQVLLVLMGYGFYEVPSLAITIGYSAVGVITAYGMRAFYIAVAFAVLLISLPILAVVLRRR